MTNYNPVVFNEGEPLDIDKLNAIHTNTSYVYEQTSQLFNTTNVNGTSVQSVPVINCGYVGQLTPYTANTLKSYELDYGASTIFAAGSIPFITATFRTPISADEIVSISVVNLAAQNGKPLIMFKSNKGHDTIRIDWIAVALKTVNANA